MTRDATALAVSFDEASTSFARLSDYQRIVLAVSGGADSTALMHLAAEHLPDDRLLVVVVDHALRQGSADEAQAVVAAARSRGLAARVMTNTATPDRAFSQAWARDVRYGLLVEAALEGLAPDARAAILTAHHLDDQAETVLMRLGRGSGIDGLAAMRRVSPGSRAGIDIVRPLLGITKARLVATLVARGVTWVEDPSNTNPRFERVRLRQHQQALDALGLTAPMLGLAAARARRASDALDFMTGRALAEIVVCHPTGFADVAWPGLLQQPAEVRLRLLARLIKWLSAEPLSLASLEAMTEGRGWAPLNGTLSHVRFVAEGDRLLLVPEVGRLRSRVFAQRAERFGPFMCSAPAGLVLMPLGGAARADRPASTLPPLICDMQPAAVSTEGRLVSAPTLGFNADTMTVELTAP